MKLNITEDNVWKTVICFSLPFFLSYFLQTFYGMADLYIIGRFCGIESTTAVSIGSQVMHMITVMIVGLAMGSVVIIGQKTGALNSRQVSKAIGNTITLFMFLSAVLTLFLIVMTDPIIKFVATPYEAITGTKYYLWICFAGIPFVVAYNVLGSILRGTGDSKSPMYFVIVACICNVLLDYLFIGFFNLEAAGAALGTILSQFISVITALIFIKNKKKIENIKKEDFRIHRDVTQKILKIGVPIALQDGFIQISFVIITIFANLRGLQDAAAVGIVEKIIGFLFLIPSSMLQTVSALSSQNIGARKYNRAQEVLLYGCMITIVWGIVCVIFMNFHSEKVIGMFSSDHQTVLMGCEYMKGYAWDCIFAGIHFCFSGYFCAYGLSGISFLQNALSIILIRIPFSYISAKYFLKTLFPMGLSSAVGSLFSVCICLIAYSCLKKRKLLK